MNAHTPLELAAYWARGWSRRLNEPCTNPQLTLKMVGRAVDACARLRRVAGSSAEEAARQAGADLSDDPEARLSIEEGSLCIRNGRGWLLWSRDLSEMTHGVSVDGIMADVAKHHSQWLAAQRK